MKDEEDFASFKIAIVGLGLMGGSLAHNFQQKGQFVLAVDPDPDTRKYAIQNQIVHRVSAYPEDFIHEADVIILSAPIDAILRFIPSLPKLHPGSPIVMDMGSTKVQICKALNSLPARFQTVGGHPICGKEVGGISNATPSLFHGSTFAFTSVNSTTDLARRYVEWLARNLGAHPIWLSPELHDRWVSITSHLPYLLSSALSLVAPMETASLVGPGFLSVSRLAGSGPDVMIPILETNRQNVLEAISNFKEKLDLIESELRSDSSSALSEILNQARILRSSILADHDRCR